MRILVSIKFFYQACEDLFSFFRNLSNHRTLHKSENVEMKIVAHQMGRCLLIIHFH